MADWVPPEYAAAMAAQQPPAAAPAQAQPNAAVQQAPAPQAAAAPPPWVPPEYAAMQAKAQAAQQAQQPVPTLSQAQAGATDAEAGMGAQLPAELAEGAQRAWGGIKQAGAAVHDVASYLTGIGKPDLGQRVTDTENARQQAAAKAHTDDPIFNAGSGMSQALIMAAPSIATDGLLSPTTGFLANLGRQSTMGATQGFLAFSPDNSKVKDAAIGGLVPAAIAAPAAAIPMAMNAVRTAINTASSATTDAVSNAKTVLGQNFPFTFSMDSGAPYARTLEGQSMNNKLQEAYKNIQQRFVAKFDQVMNLSVNSAVAPDMDSAFATGLKKAQDGIAGMRQGASKAYDDGMASAQKLSDQIQSPGSPGMARPGRTFNQSTGTWQAPQASGLQVPVTNLQAQLDVVAKQAHDPVALGGDIDPKFVSFLDGVKAQQGANPNMGAANIAYTLRGLTGIINREDSTPTTVALAHKLMDSLNHDLDLVPKGSQSDQVVQQILKTRADYQQSLTAMENLQNSATYKMFGLGPKQTVADPDTLLKTYAGFSPAKQKQVVGWMDQNSPQLLQAMRRQTVQNAVGAANVTSHAASNADVDPRQLIDHLFSDGKLATSGLWTPTQVKQLYAFRDGANVIANAPIPAAARNISTPAAAEIAPNLVSQSPIFIARQIARAVTGAKGADLFTDPQVYSMFYKLRNTSGSGQAAIRASLGAYINSNYGDGNANTQPQGQ